VRENNADPKIARRHAIAKDTQMVSEMRRAVAVDRIARAEERGGSTAATDVERVEVGAAGGSFPGLENMLVAGGFDAARVPNGQLGVAAPRQDGQRVVAARVCELVPRGGGLIINSIWATLAASWLNGSYWFPF